MPGLVALAVVGAVWDAFAVIAKRETISQAVRRLAKNRDSRALLVGSAVALVLHLAHEEA